LLHPWQDKFHAVVQRSYVRKKESVADVLDGTSTSVAVAEYHTLSDYPRARGFWGFGRNQYCMAQALYPAASRLPDTWECRRTLSEDACIASSAAFHPGGHQALCVDGSVRLISRTINGSIWMALCTIAGGEAMPSP
jgi:hypothetical protein